MTAVISTPGAGVQNRIHILSTPALARPWWRTDERLSDYAGHKIWTDCCCCKRPAEETDCRIVTAWDPPSGGYGCYQDPPAPWSPIVCQICPDLPTGAYYEPHIDVRCADGFGCTAKPRMRWGRHLREYIRYG